MIDWFPTSSAADPAVRLARWQGLLDLRRTARAIDALDPSTVGHSERVADVAAAIAADHGWEPWRIARLREAGVVHDVGKACVPRAVLLTPGPLTPSQFEAVKAHASVGAEAAGHVLTRRQAAWIRHHHERWDGRGYPGRLAGEEIPDGAAILCLADAWDAMTHRSWSGDALTRAQALEECRGERGRQFAPWAVVALERALERSAVPPPAARVPRGALLVPAH